MPHDRRQWLGPADSRRSPAPNGAVRTGSAHHVRTWARVRSQAGQLALPGLCLRSFESSSRRESRVCGLLAPQAIPERVAQIFSADLKA